MSWSQTRAEARHSTIAAGKREQMVVWTKVVATEIKKSKGVHIYLEVEPTAPAEGLTVDSGGSRLTLRSICSTLHAGHLPMHFSKGTDG